MSYEVEIDHELNLAYLTTRYNSLLSERANGKALSARVYTDYQEAKNWCCYR